MQPMANRRQARAENADGDFFVDESCIDCDACRWVAPESFTQVNGQSAVTAQPRTKAQRRAALHALVACPTASIGCTEAETKQKLREAIKDFPLHVAENVYYCGFHSEASFGAASYLILRESGNVLVDSPRFAAPLVKRIAELGGLRWIYLTHRDDVADHEKWAERFGAERVIHKDDARGLGGIERVLTGQEDVWLDDDLRVIVVPGHTKGHTVLLHDKFLFTGDHLAWSAPRGHLVAFRRACWYSWDELKVSMRKLRGLGFEWVLPGHGRRHHAESGQMQADLEHCIQWMETV
jgi:glyoxylase-like metal-dependent hydrolase (beta-lactamase superfamily II)/ferredoxin